MINLTVVIDNDEAVRKLHELQRVAKSTTSSVVKDSERMDASWQQMKNTLMSLTAGVSFAALAKQVVQVRGEVQQLEVAFETLLGSKEKADTLMSEIIDLAAKTPFGLQDVSNATKMLLAYGSTAEEVTGEIKMLGNIASGLSIPLNDLIYLYGTTRTQGRMFTMDLRQFMGRGIPLAEELAKQFGVTKEKVGELVTAGKVGFDDMAKALQAMSSEGGKFNNLMDKQSQTISGQISNLEDAIYQMFNEIGKSSEGVISDLISGASWVVEHYQEVLNVLTKLVVAYGAYKTALILVAAGHKAMALLELSSRLYSVLKSVTSLTQAMRVLNTVIKANPIGLLLSVLSTIVAVVWDFADGTEEAVKQMGELEKAARDEHIEVNKLVYQLNQANISEEERNRLLNELKSINPNIVKGIGDEADMTAVLTSNLKAYNDEQIKRIQLASLTDRQNKAIEDFANADLNLQTYKGKVEERMAQLVAEYMASGKLPEVKVRWNSPKSREEIERDLRNVLESAAAGKINGVELARELYSTVQSPVGANAGSTVDIVGIDEDYIGGKLARLTKKADDAKKKLETETKEVQVAAETLGLTIDSVTNGVDTVTGGETHTSATTKEQDDAKKRAKEAAKLAKELQYDADQAVIDAMAEGTERKVAQIRLDYRKRAETIQQQEAELKEKQGGNLTAEQEAAFNALNKANVYEYIGGIGSAAFEEAQNKVKAKRAEQAVMDEYLIQYGEYQEKRLAITRKYSVLIAEAETQGEKMTLKKEQENALAELEVAMAEKSDLWVKLFSDASKMTRSQLKSIIADTKELLNYLNGVSKAKPKGFSQEQLDSLAKDVEAIKDIYDALIEKQEQYEEKTQYPFDGIVKGIKNIIEARKAEAEALKATTDDEKAAAKARADALKGDAEHNIYQGALQAANAIAFLSDCYTTLAEATGDERIKESAGQIAALSQNVSAAAQGAASGGWIGAIIGGVTDMITQSIDAVATNTAEAVELEQNTIDFAREYKLTLLSLKDEDYESIFGTKSLEKAQDAYKSAQEALKAYKEELNQQLELVEPTVIERQNSLGASIFAGFWTGRRITELQESIFDAFSKGYNALEGLQVKTKDRSAWANFWGAQDQYTSLKDLAPELWDEDDQFNIDAAKAFLETNTQISDAQRKQIQNVVDLQEKYDELMEVVDEEAREIFGDLSGDLTNIIYDSITNGTDAWDDFEKRGGEVLDTLAKKMIEEKIVGEYLAGYDEQIRTAVASGDASQIAQVTNDIFSGLGGVLAGARVIAEETERLKQEYGLDTGVSGQTSTSKGFQAMSQDTGDEFNGRFTDIQGKVSGIHEAVQFMKSLSTQQLQHVSSIDTTVAMIHNDTTLIERHAKELYAIREGIDRLNKNIEGGLV